MGQYVGQPADVEVYILLHARANDNAAEADEEINGRFRFQIAHPVTDERCLAVRACADVTHGKLLATAAREKRTAIKVLVTPARVKGECNGMYVPSGNAQCVSQRKDGLFDAAGDEMNDHPAAL